MQAMVINQFGGPEQLVLKDIPTPVPENSEVLIKVKALGINRAEVYMRKGLFGEVTRVSGIELPPLKVGLASLNEGLDTFFNIFALHNRLQVRQKLLCCSLFTFSNG